MDWYSAIRKQQDELEHAYYAYRNAVTEHRNTYDTLIGVLRFMSEGHDTAELIRGLKNYGFVDGELMRTDDNEKLMDYLTKINALIQQKGEQE